MKLYVLFLCLFVASSIFAQRTNIVRELEENYQNNTLTHTDRRLLLVDSDSDTIKATKNYFKAVLTTDEQNMKLEHELNFRRFPQEIYAQQSGLQLVQYHILKKEYDAAATILDAINSAIIPEALYWKAKISQLTERYDDAIFTAQNFINRYSRHQLSAQAWLIVFEALAQKKDSTLFERNLTTFYADAESAPYRAYLLYMQATMHEDTDENRATTLYTQIVTEFPSSQFRVQAEDRLYAMRESVQPINETPTIQNNPINNANNSNTATFTNEVVSNYQSLRKNAFYIQFGVFTTDKRARDYLNTLNRERIDTFYISKPVGGRQHFAVIQGPFSTIEAAQEMQRTFTARNYQTFIFRAE